MRGIRVLFAAGLSALSALAAPCGEAASPAPAAAYLADVTTIAMTSSVSHRAYQISIALPSNYAPGHAPYAVLFAADANAQFGTIVETARLLSLGGLIPPLVVVGIGYANPGQGYVASFAPRSLDLTPTVSAKDLAYLENFAHAVDFPVPTATGGADEFLTFLRGELVPYIEAHYNVSHQDRAWLGHSYGGLFGAYALLHNDGLFQRFVIGSPSLFYDDGAIFRAEESYAATHKAMPARLYLSVGAEEENDGDDRMVGNLAHLAAQLRQRHYDGLTVESEIFNGETHASVIPLTIFKGLRSIYGR